MQWRGGHPTPPLRSADDADASIFKMMELSRHQRIGKELVASVRRQMRSYRRSHDHA